MTSSSALATVRPFTTKSVNETPTASAPTLLKTVGNAALFSIAALLFALCLMVVALFGGPEVS
jgi:hypothetical protein